MAQFRAWGHTETMPHFTNVYRFKNIVAKYLLSKVKKGTKNCVGGFRLYFSTVKGELCALQPNFKSMKEAMNISLRNIEFSLLEIDMKGTALSEHVLTFLLMRQ